MSGPAGRATNAREHCPPSADPHSRRPRVVPFVGWVTCDVVCPTDGAVGGRRSRRGAGPSSPTTRVSPKPRGAGLEVRAPERARRSVAAPKDRDIFLVADVAGTLAQKALLCQSAPRLLGDGRAAEVLLGIAGCGGLRDAVFVRACPRGRRDTGSARSRLALLLRG